MRLLTLIALAAVVVSGGLAASGSAVSQSRQGLAQTSALKRPVHARTAKGIPAQGPASGGVDWRAAYDASVRSEGKALLVRAPGIDPAVVDRTAVPVLLISDPMMETARLYSFGDQYTLAARIAGAHVAMTGTTTLVPLPPTTRLSVTAKGPEGLVVQRTVDGQLASFTRYGVLYTVELRCDQPTDAICRSEAAVRALQARTDVVVMGKAALAAAGLGQ
jgi:hypothetical protein